MTPFEKADQKLSAAMDQALAEPVRWRPMASRSGSGGITTGPASPSRPIDPSRPPRGVDQTTDPFVAIVSWATNRVIDSGTNAAEQGSIIAAAVVLDFDRRAFMTPDGEKLPQRNDVFEVWRNGRWVKVQLPRALMDDGSARIVIPCNEAE